MPSQTLSRIAARIPYLAALPLLVMILLGTSEMLHSQLQKIGERYWTDYHSLRTDPVKPNCDTNPNIESRLQDLIAEHAAQAEDDLLGLFDAEPLDTEALKQSLLKSREQCRKQHVAYEKNIARITPNLERFRAIEQSVLKLNVVDDQLLLIALFLFCAIITAAQHHHISLRPVVSKLDFRVSVTSQLLANLAIALSMRTLLHKQYESGTVVTEEALLNLLQYGFFALTAFNAVQLVKAPAELSDEKHFAKSLLSIPLYAFMTFTSLYYYLSNEGSLSGLAIHFNALASNAWLFVNVGLYIWAGMMLKQSTLGEKIFALLKPWKLSPEIMAFVAVIIMALPTAYTGASGIIVIAMGAVVYQELRRVGARRQLALAATAMSGSLGVVLRPCLLVVVIAALNKQVTTDELFHWGLYVFLLTSVLFFIVSLVAKEHKLQVAHPQQALRPMLQQLLPLMPYVGIVLLVIAFAWYALDAIIDEHKAPIFLPIIMISILFFEKTIVRIWRQRTEHQMESADGIDVQHEQNDEQEKEAREELGKASRFRKAIAYATRDATVHIGALLMLMACSLCVGGVIESSEIVTRLPETFDSVWMAMSLLVVALVIIGMSMDAFGAVILVTGTIATVAYNNGIHPLHFWMTTLVAFELGYLSPPVALNHLLTRQVVGEKEVMLASQEGDTFWQRHEKILLPITVMGIALVLVAFVPLLFY